MMKNNFFEWITSRIVSTIIIIIFTIIITSTITISINNQHHCDVDFNKIIELANKPTDQILPANPFIVINENTTIRELQDNVRSVLNGPYGNNPLVKASIRSFINDFTICER